ncbi:hypothetical protein SAMN04488515_1178 [Cognatiyoonia koreensis]|uniref:Uncharacterized protein n=1 Tax=Cognatiyoonia koreensis TaxID=364200 RepID=A0A1I0PDV4_9RHOB|nr:hypothetical protein [Cognatiyoonia koreensis]SEW12577.1 hypothetical protein SAMN04488515_1178 [Cognatiyoonia koreensis]
MPVLHYTLLLIGVICAAGLTITIITGFATPFETVIGGGLFIVGAMLLRLVLARK